MEQRLLYELVKKIAVTVCYLALTFVAQFTYGANPESKSESIERICTLSPVDCLTQVDIALHNKNQSDLIKYDLLQYRFVALFNLQRNKTLREETQQWLSEENLPISFKITVYIYHAKSLRSFGEKEQSRIYADKAMALLAQMNEVFPSPMRLIELANLQMQYGDVEQAYILMKGMLSKYQRSNNALFQMELNGNLGHAAGMLGKFEESKALWLVAIHWSNELGNTQQQAVTHYNLADIYESLKQYDNANAYFQLALNYSQQAKDINKARLTKMRIALILIAQQKECEAAKVLATIEAKLLPESWQHVYQKAVNNLPTCS